MAARDRQLGPLPEQRPTGWHRLVFANPPRPDQPVLPPTVPGSAQSDPLQSDWRHPSWTPTVAGVGRPLQPAGPDSAPQKVPEPPVAGPGVGGTHRQPRPARRQIGRVLDPRPDRVRRSAMLVAALAAAAAAGVCAVLLVSAETATPEPAPGPAVPSVVGSGPASVDPTAAAPTP